MAQETTTPPAPQFTVHDRCLKARRDQGLTQEELAAAIDVSPRSITRYETGAVTKPRAIVLKQWALACGVDYHWLRFGPSGTTSRYPQTRSDQRERTAA